LYQARSVKKLRLPYGIEEVVPSGTCQDPNEEEESARVDLSTLIGVFVIILVVMLIFLAVCCFCKKNPNYEEEASEFH